MNLLDFVLITILGYCLVRGIFRGLVKELSSIVGVMGGFYAAYTYYPQMAKLFSRWMADAGHGNILGFLILFIGVYLVISFTGVIIKHLMNIVFLGWLDRIGGALFGTLKGVLITTVVIIMLTTFLPKNAAILSRSLVSRHMMAASATLVKVVPDDMKKHFSEKMHELRKSWQSKKI